MFPIRTSVPNRDIPAVVIAIIVANIAVYVVQVGLSETETARFLLDYALVPARIIDVGNNPLSFLTILSSTFLHGGIFHLAINMWTLWLFGPALESRYGAFGFLGFYLICGICAGLAHLAFNLGSEVPAVGASGAIAGILGGFTLLHLGARITLIVPILIFPLLFTLPAAIYTALWFGFQIIPGLLELDAAQPKAGIAWWAHIGGLATGMVLARLMPDSQAEKHIRPGRLNTSVQAGHRPRMIMFGVQPDDAMHLGQQRPTVIRLGKPRKSQPSASTDDILDLADDLPPPSPRGQTGNLSPKTSGRSSSIPITEKRPASDKIQLGATAKDESSERLTENIWKSAR